MKHLLWSLLVLCALPLPAHAGEEETVKVLFIGNSYTIQIRGQMNALLKASPHKRSTFEYVASGGATLTRHLANEKVVTKIKEGGWDYVVLQEQSQTPGLPGLKEKFLESAKALCKLIHKSGAEPVFYMTWGHRDGDKHNPKSYPDYETMQKRLAKAYRKAAKANDAHLMPAGEVWADVGKELKGDFAALYRGDGRHPSGYGAFLVACSFFRFVLGSDLDFVEPTDDKQKLIKEAVLDRKKRK